MNKLSYVLDSLYLNIALLFGIMALLGGALLGWNICAFWRILGAIYGLGVIVWLVWRLVSTCKADVEVSEKMDDFPDVKPGLRGNALREFLQPLALILFLVILSATWLETEMPPRWFVYFLLACLILIGWLNFSYYKGRER